MIRTENLSMRFENESAIRYRDLTFADGQSYVLLGASGCGKSTLLNLLCGILTPTSGSVWIDDFNISAAAQRERDLFRIAGVGYIFQDFKLIEDMTVEDNINILRLERVDVSGMDDLLSELGIRDKKRRRVRSLSGGEKQRVAIARALIKRPGIILADEPTGNLNYETGRRIMEDMTQSARGRTLIAVTHDDRLCDLFDHTLYMAELLTGGDRNA